MTSQETAIPAPAEKFSLTANIAEGVVNIESKRNNDEHFHSQPTENVKFGHYIRIFSYATRVDQCLLLLGCTASVGAGITLPLMTIVFETLVGGFNTYFTSGSSESKESFDASINRLTLYLVYLWIGKFVLCYIAMFTFRVAGIRISAAIRLAYVNAVFTQSISVLDRLPPGQTASTITTKANVLQLGISEKLSVCLQSIALLVSAYAIAFRYSWTLTLVTSSVLFFVLIVYGALVPVTVKLQRSKDHADEKGTSIASEVIGSIRMVVACGAEERLASRFGGWVKESRRRGLKLSPWLGTQLAPVFFTIFADFALTFWFGVRLYIQGDISSISTVLIVLTSVLMSIMSLGRIVTPLIDVSKAASAASSFFAMIDAPVASADGLTEPEVSASNDIVLENVTFAYPSRPHVKVLDGVDMCFESGKLTAIVGPSGSGKSTVVGLLERWYELEAEAGSNDAATMKKELGNKRVLQDETSLNIVPSGKITIGRYNINQINMKWWRSQIGLVAQEPFIFNDTIYNNVSHGLIGSKFEKVDEATKMLLVREACREANADEFIKRLPMGLETTVGDSGIKLSGGQRQRLAIARSIIKQPQILILDEATSAVDVRGEQIVQEALDRVSRKRTTITIAHRLSTIRKADNIMVVVKGKVMEQGTHDQLLAKQTGLYYKLVYAQHLAVDPTDSIDPITSDPWEFETKAADAEDEWVETITEQPKDNRNMRGVFGSFGLLLLEQRSRFPWLFGTLVGALGASIALPLQSYLMANSIVAFSLTGQALVANSEHWSLLFLFLAVFIGVAYFIIGWASNSFGTHVSSTNRQEYFSSVVKQPIAFFDAEDHSVGTLTARISSDPMQLFEMMGPNMAFAAISVLSIMGCVAIAFAFGWKLTLVTIFSSLAVILVASWYRIRYEIVFENMNAAVFAESSKFASETIGAFRTVTSVTLESLIYDRYATLLYSHVDAATRKARFSTLIFALSDSVNLLCMSITFWYGGRLLGSFEYNPIQFLVIYIAIIQGSESAGQWMSFGPNIAAATAASNRILGFRVKESATSKAALALPPPGGGAEIAFQKIHFTYPTRDTPIFRCLSFTINAGQFAAFVGASGCGKTTLVSLLEQFYTIQKGTIRLDGVDITDLDIAEYRAGISLVSQEPSLFQGTIRENILVAVNKDTATEADLHQACREAEIHDFITSLPDGYETDIGSRGVALSGGQKQRIAIARALIRKPRILLLDEATSSLDSESEKLVQASFERAGRGRTVIAIAHRISTISNADVIFVLGSTGEENGASILEKGTHQTLLDRRGVYWQMCAIQGLDSETKY